MVIAHNEKPAPLHWQGSLVLDPECHAHKTYGTAAQALYLVRPDGHVGFRSQPISFDALLEYLHRIHLRLPEHTQLASDTSSL